MTTTHRVPTVRSPAASWVNRVLIQYLAAASLRTISGAGSRATTGALRVYLSRVS
jgi:hypothetical protein